MISLARQASDFFVREQSLLTPFGPQEMVLTPDSTRVAVAFQANGTSIRISTKLANDAQFAGFMLYTGVNPMVFLFKDWGAAVQGAWYADGPNLNSNLQILESCYRPAGYDAPADSEDPVMMEM